MASISIVVGAVTSTATTSNANAQAILSDYIESFGGPVNGTSQEQLDWVVKAWINQLRATANRQKAKKLADAAVVGVDTRDWT